MAPREQFLREGFAGKLPADPAIPSMLASSMARVIPPFREAIAASDRQLSTGDRRCLFDPHRPSIELAPVGAHLFP